MMEFLSVLWFFLIFVLIAGYFVLDGFDLGIGVLSPFIAKNDEERAVLRRAIGPVWDGNEVWLLTAGGALFAAFPDAYATTFSGFYLAVMLVLFGLIVRAVSFEFRAGDPSWGKLWDACFFVGSLLPALLLGVAVGNIFAGIPMDAAGDYAGVPLIGLITPFTLLTGLLGLAMFLAAGACWAALKAPLPSLPSGPRRTAAPAPASDRACSVRRGVRVRPRSCRARDGSELGHPAVAVRGAGGGGAAGLARRGQDVRGRPEGVSGPVRVHDRARGASGLFHVPRARERHGRFRGARPSPWPTPHRRSCRSPG